MKRIKYILTFLFFAFFLGSLSISQQSCSPGYGCEMEEKGKQSMTEKMTSSSKRGKSNLFPKRMRRKMNK